MKDKGRDFFISLRARHASCQKVQNSTAQYSAGLFCCVPHAWAPPGDLWLFHHTAWLQQSAPALPQETLPRCLLHPPP